MCPIEFRGKVLHYVSKNKKKSFNIHNIALTQWHIIYNMDKTITWGKYNYSRRKEWSAKDIKKKLNKNSTLIKLYDRLSIIIITIFWLRHTRKAATRNSFHLNAFPIATVHFFLRFHSCLHFNPLFYLSQQTKGSSNEAETVNRKPTFATELNRGSNDCKIGLFADFKRKSWFGCWSILNELMSCSLEC